MDHRTARSDCLRALAWVLAWVGLISASPAQAQLSTGDLVTICWNSDGDDDFALIALAPIPGNTRIFLADNGWSTSTGTLMGESSVPFLQRQIQFDVAAAGIAFGTVIGIDQTASGSAVLATPAQGTLTMVDRFANGQANTGLSFGSAGDQLLVYQTAGGNPAGAVTMVSGFNQSPYSNAPTITIANGWQVGTLPQAGQTGGTSESNAPGGLVVYTGSNGSTATALGLGSFAVDGLTGVDNYKYSGSTALGTKTAFLTAINDPTNWDANDTTPYACVFGAGASPEVAVSGNATSIADGDATPSLADHTDFGNVDTTSGTVVRTYTIANSGSAALTLGSVGVGGTHAADFSVTLQPASPVGLAGSTTFQVTFNPSTTGLRSATLSFATNDADENPFDFSIQGTGIAPEIAVSGNSVNIADGDVTPSASDHTDFGSSDVASGSIVRTFTIGNSGGAPLTLGTVSLVGGQASDFSLTLAPNGPVAAGGSTTFQITFDPSALGLRGTTVSFISNDADESPFDFSIQGTGTGTPDIAVSGNGVNIVDGDATPSTTDHTDFGAVAPVGASLVRTFTIANAGNANLTLGAGSIVTTGVHAADFGIGGITLPATVTPSGSTTFTVSFDPATTGLRSAEINIASNDIDESSFNFAVQGTGAAADLQVSKTNFESGLLPGRDTIYTIQVLNAGPDAVGSVRVVDDVPNTELTNAAWTCSSSPPALCPSASGGPDIDQTTGTLPSGALLQYTLIATPAGAPPAFITNTATVTNNDGSDPNAGNDSASDTDPVVPEGILADGFEQAPTLLRPSIAQ